MQNNIDLSLYTIKPTKSLYSKIKETHQIQTRNKDIKQLVNI